MVCLLSLARWSRRFWPPLLVRLGAAVCFGTAPEEGIVLFAGGGFDGGTLPCGAIGSAFLLRLRRDFLDDLLADVLASPLFRRLWSWFAAGWCISWDHSLEVRPADIL